MCFFVHSQTGQGRGLIDGQSNINMFILQPETCVYLPFAYGHNHVNVVKLLLTKKSITIFTGSLGYI